MSEPRKHYETPRVYDLGHLGQRWQSNAHKRATLAAILYLAEDPMAVQLLAAARFVRVECMRKLREDAGS